MLRKWIDSKRAVERRDEGATLLLVTASMLVLLLFGAFAVDLGGAWSQRRENQAAVDPAGMAGALLTAGLTQPNAIAAADSEIVRITYNSIDPAMTPAEWATAWATCTDPDKGAEFSVTGSSDCISYTSTLQRIRVKTPLVDTETAFAAIIGLDTLQTDAAVEVLMGLQDRGAILPFGLPGNAAGSNEICLKTSEGPAAVPPCDGPETGNFGFLSFNEYGNTNLSPITTTSCGGGTPLLARNIAHGADHPIVEAPGATATPKYDRDGCSPTVNFNYEPYTMITTGATGNKEPAVFAGLVGGSGGFTGRLANAPVMISTPKGSWDDRPLQYYLNDAGVTLCGGRPSDAVEMQVCLDIMKAAGSATYFIDDLKDSGRFAWVPLFYNNTFGIPGTPLNIEEFRPVFLHTTLWGCNPGGCDGIHTPGEDVVGDILSTYKLDALTALQIPRKNLPAIIDDGFFGSGSQTFYAITD